MLGRNNKIFNNNNNSSLRMSKSQRFTFVFSLVILLLSSVLIIVGITASALLSQKGATGSVTFEFSTPALTMNNGFKLFYKDNALTYGSSTGIGDNIETLQAFEIGISSNAELAEYYIKVIYDFGSVTNGSISFGNNTYTVNGYTMSAMTQIAGEAGRFESISTSAIAKGTKINILQYLQNFTYSNEENYTTSTPLDFTITIVVDNSNQFNSLHKNELVYEGKLGIDHNKAYTLGTVTLDLNGGVGDNKVYYEGEQFKITGEAPTSTIADKEFYFFADTAITNSNIETASYNHYEFDTWYDLPTQDITLTATYLTPNVLVEEGETSVNVKQYAQENNITTAIVSPQAQTVVGNTTLDSNLQTVILPYTTKTIGGNAFNNCSALNRLIIPTTIESINEGAFSNSYWYNNVTSGTDGVYKVGEIVYIQRVLYDGGETSGEITLKDNTISITSNAFNGCTGLTKVTMPQGLKYIGSSAFNGCTALSSIVVPNSVESIGENTFTSTPWYTNKSDGVGGISIVDGVVYIQRVLYDGSNSTNYVNVKSDTISITGSAFKGNTTLETIVVNSVVKEIGANTFNGCTNLTNINIPKSVQAIGGSALSGCTGLTSIKVDSGNTYYKGNTQNTLLIETKTGSIIVGCNVPSVSIPADVKTIQTGAFAGNTNINELVFEEGCQIESIGTSAFAKCTSLTKIVIPASVKILKSNAFNGCSGLVNLTFEANSSLAEIESDVFSGCVQISNNVVLPQSIEVIGNRAFNGCSNMSGNLILPEKLQTIGVSVFYGCSNITGDLIIPNNVTTIGSNAFRNCTGLNGRLLLGSNLVSIANDAFNGCKNISSLEMSADNKLTTIGNRAFNGCSNMVGELIFTQTLNSIGVSSFNGCSKLYGEIFLSSQLTSIGSSAFKNCSGLTGDLIISANITTIDADAFNGCANIASLVFEEGSKLTTIGNRAFTNCANIANSIIFPSSVESIGFNAFNGCGAVTFIELGSITPPTLGDSVFDNTNNCPIYVPSESVESYKQATNWSTYASRIQAIA